MNTTKPKILIVDDERYNITLLVKILQGEYKTIVAKDGEEALKRMAADIPPDLILLDIMMPDLDGYEVCRRLKADEATREIPVIFVTDMGDEEDETRGLELGAIDYLTKPISPAIVKARVKNHLALKLARQQLALQNQELREAAQLREDVERMTRHDHKNPLSAIIAYPQFLRETPGLSDIQQKFIDNIEDAGFKMLDMINRSLDVFKMERGIYEYSPREVDLMPLVKKIVVETQALSHQKHLFVNLLRNDAPVRDGSTYMVMGEELLCYSMLANLIKNALEASPYRSPVTVTFGRKEQHASIRIHNNGVVPENIRDRFFEKYATSGKKSGIGLGTYSAHLIATTQGGNIQMTTAEAEGTLIEIYLRPASDPEEK